MRTKDKKILIVIGGGVSAYKSLDLIRLLKKDGFLIKSVLTRSGRQFVTPLSLVSLSGGKVYENLFDKENEAEIDHISLSRWADLIMVVPATANLISKLSQGKADDLASTIMLASNKDIVLVPAMNVRMWGHKATQENCKKLITYGYKFFGPTEGQMACGEFGKGKMLSPKKIFKGIKDYFHKKDIVKNKKLKALVTAGPTREYLDPVRFISNESSGKQGYEIALALKRRGIKTTLIAGPSNLAGEKGLKIIRVKTSDEMFRAVKKNLSVDIAVCTAAVSDYKPSLFQKNKIKKIEKKQNFFVEQTVDILDFISKNNTHRPKLVIGFSAETQKLLNNSKSKLKEKNCDWIIANDVSKKDSGFESDYNEVVIYYKDLKNKKEKLSFKKKSEISEEIVDRIVAQIN